jgi:phage terminase large subunit-like protein
MDIATAMAQIRAREAEVEARKAAKERAGRVGGELSGRVSLSDTQLQLRRARQVQARRRFAAFARWGWPEVEGDTELAWNWHLDAICDHVQAQLEDWARARLYPAAEWAQMVKRAVHSAVLRAQNFIVNLPPRSLKTTLITVMATAWAWVHWPSMSIMTFSANPRVTSGASKDFIKLVSSKWYREVADAAADARERDLDGTNEATGRLRWMIPKDAAESEIVNVWVDRSGGPGGVRKARGMESQFVGEGADWLIADDPHGANDVFSDLKRAAVHGKWDREVFSRVNDPGRSIRTIVMQRLHVDDLTAHVLENKEHAWALLILQMEYDGPRATRLESGAIADDRVGTWLGWRDPRGELEWSAGPILHPERFSDAFIAGEKAQVSKWLAQFQQKPDDIAGGMFKRASWRFWAPAGAPPPTKPRPEGCVGREEFPARIIGRRPDGQLEFDWVALTVDATFKKTSDGSRVGLLVIGGYGKDRFIIHDASRRLSYPETKAAIRALVGCGIVHEDVYASALAAARRRITKVLVELKANGDAIVSEISDTPEGETWPGRCAVIGLETDSESYISRAVAMSDTVEGGHWHLLEDAPWLESSCGDLDDLGFLPEVSAFPNGKRDDRIDAASQCHNHFAGVIDLGTHQRAWR